MNKESIWDKIYLIDKRILYSILLIGMAIPYVRPLGIPITINPQTRDLYDRLLELETKDVVAIDIQYGVSSWAEYLPGFIAAVKICVQQDAKLVVWGKTVDCDITWNKVVESVPELVDYTYGEDYVWLGFYAGGETTVAQLAEDIRSVYPNDYYGTPVDEIPLMENVNDVHDVQLILGTGGGDNDWYIRHWTIPYGTDIVVIGISMLGSTFMPYYKSGQLIGMTVGVRGCAELEMLINQPGDATTTMDSINVSHLLVVVAIIISNIGYFASTRSRRGH